MLDLCLAGSRILCFWYILESFHKFIIELRVLQCLFARGSNKKQRRSRIISNFTKGETFSSLGGNLTMWTLQERPFSPLRFGQEENISGHSTESRAYWFILKIAKMFPIFTSRNRITNTFIIANINPICGHVRYSSLYAFPFKSPSFSLQFDQEQYILGHSFVRRA